MVTQWGHGWGFEQHGKIWALYWRPENGLYMWHIVTYGPGDLAGMIAFYKNPAFTTLTWIYLEAPHPTEEELIEASVPSDEARDMWMAGKFNSFLKPGGQYDVKARAFLARYCPPALTMVGQ